MEKMKGFFHKINKNLILYLIIVIVILVIANFILKLFHLKFRQWVYYNHFDNRGINTYNREIYQTE